jgi:putative FmdB family regulatory protein
MPVYTYECENCGERFEAKQKFSDEPLTVCPTCEGPVHRVIQPVRVVFKGSGFYVTDSRGKQIAPTPAAKKEGAKSSENGGDSPSSDTKAETSTATNKTEASTTARASSAE